MSKPIRVLTIVTVALVASTLTGAARAQDPRALLAGPGPDADRLRAIEAELRDESRARILGPFVDIEVTAPRARDGGVRFEGVVRRYGGSVPQGDHLAWFEIEKVQVRRSSAGTGAIIGMVVGAVAGLATGMISMHHHCQGNDLIFCEWDGADVAAAAAVSAGVGLLIGAPFGEPFHHWKTVYDATD